MKKCDLIKGKHLLVSRSKHVYFYIDSNDGRDMMCLSPNIDAKPELWDDNLLCVRESCAFYNEPRDFDIIYIYEITDTKLFIKRILGENFICYDTLRDGVNYFGSHKQYIKQIYEMIDSGMN